MDAFQSMFLTILGVILAAWILAGLVAGLAYTMGGPRLTSARQTWRY
jgi:hypothetical protein